AWIPPQAEYSVEGKRRDEYDTLGLLASRHPMTLYQRSLDAVPHVTASRLAEYVGRRVTLAGWLVTGKTVATKHGEAMEFMTFEDLTGLYETTFFPESYRKNAPFLNTRRPFWISG